MLEGFEASLLVRARGLTLGEVRGLGLGVGVAIAKVDVDVMVTSRSFTLCSLARSVKLGAERLNDPGEVDLGIRPVMASRCENSRPNQFCSR
jgi:hypothetical protein